LPRKHPAPNLIDAPCGQQGGVCRLCEDRPAEPGGALCSGCRSHQRRLLIAEAAGAGVFFASVSALLYLLGRWYAG
jgi:hypothetical protein